LSKGVGTSGGACKWALKARQLLFETSSGPIVVDQQHTGFRGTFSTFTRLGFP